MLLTSDSVSIWAGVWVRARLHTDTTQRGASQVDRHRVTELLEPLTGSQNSSSSSLPLGGDSREGFHRKRQALKRVAINTEQKRLKNLHYVQFLLRYYAGSD